MKKIYLVVSAAIVCLASCKEVGPSINFRNVIPLDTSYVAAVEAPQNHNVLIEEFTGQSCSNCPAAHDDIVAMEAHNTGRINAIGLYVYGPNQTSPPSGAKVDFRDSTANLLALGVAGSAVSAIPAAMIDRTIPGGVSSVILDQPWDNYVQSDLSGKGAINLYVKSNYNAVTGSDSIIVKVAYASAVSSAQNLSVVIVEDSIIDIQEYPPYGIQTTYPTGYDPAYVFTNVFRSLINNTLLGDPVLPAQPQKPAGQVYQRTYITQTRTSWVPNHCRVIAFVTDAATKVVLQSVQCQLTSH